ncbi:hypothetical protein [Rhodococcus aetherivorans]|uniref:hypothetical protein n=1 Tax=Rhodococcus aetherivorans TaxID=191292 RepID=UPI00294955DB|nr:hypothetical protein [Rhodococcus aetherivorans]MDV6295165.1 hypothetical protein [Rhodococcus aetherivorans]
MPDQTDETDIIERRTAHFKELRQGEGLTLEKLEALGDEVRVFGVETPQEALDLIRIAATSMLDNQYAVAIRNALGIGQVVEGKLTERRYDLLERSDVKLRMLMRHEDEGAEMLARQIDITRQLRPDLSAGVDMVDLVGRIDGISAKLNELDVLERRLRVAEVLAALSHEKSRIIRNLLGHVTTFGDIDADSIWDIQEKFDLSMEQFIPSNRLRSMFEGIDEDSNSEVLKDFVDNDDAMDNIGLLIGSIVARERGFESVAKWLEAEVAAEEARSEVESGQESVSKPFKLRRSRLSGEDADVKNMQRDIEKLQSDMAKLIHNVNQLVIQQTAATTPKFGEPNTRNYLFGEPGQQ